MGRNRFSAWLVLALAPVALWAVSAPRDAAADLEPGAVRAVQARAGLALREAPKGRAKVLRMLPYGSRVTVAEIAGLYAKVEGPEGATGWARSADLVDPAVLSGAGSRGPVGATEFSSSEISAAGRQFDLKTERTYRKMDEKLDAFFPLVDQVERSTPTDEDLDAFIGEGRLGRPLEPPTVASAVKLRLLGVEGGAAVNPNADPAWSQIGVSAISDADYIRQMDKYLSPEQEYFLGRSVAAAAIAEYGLDPDPARQALVRRIGEALVRLSDLVRGTYGGYHFAVLNSDLANGLSGPGGFVLVTRGALDLARNEEEVAGVLAHEIAHVSLKHGEAVIRRSKEWREAIRKLEEEAARPPPVKPEDCNTCADMAKLLGNSAKKLVTSLADEGYGKDFEFRADWDGSVYLCEAGYRVSAIAEYLQLLPDRKGVKWVSHPSSLDRIDALRPMLLRHCDPEDAGLGQAARLARFQTLLGRR